MYVCVCVYDDFIALVVSGIVLARQCQGEVRLAQFVFFLKGKEILYPPLDFFKNKLSVGFDYVYVYIFLSILYKYFQYLDIRAS